MHAMAQNSCLLKAWVSCAAKTSWVTWMTTRKGPDGEVKPIPTWEKIYWGFGLTGLALMIIPRLILYSRTKPNKEEEEVSEKGFSVALICVSFSIIHSDAEFSFL